MEKATFKTFRTNEEAEEMQLFLLKNNLHSQINKNGAELIDTFTGDFQDAIYQLLLNIQDFGYANQLLETDALNNIEKLPKDYYLYQFADEELYDILLKPDEWGELDVQLSKKILNTRGKKIDPSLILSLRNRRMQDLRQPEKEDSSWIAAAYMLSILGGLLGIILGHFFWNSKKTIPNGQKIYRYTENTRRHGKHIFLLGVFFLILWVSVRAYYKLMTTY